MKKLSELKKENNMIMRSNYVVENDLNNIFQSITIDYDLEYNWLGDFPIISLDKEFGCDLRSKLLTLEKEDYESMLKKIESVIEKWAKELLCWWL